jgi:predicted nucleotidyltransferase
MEIDIPASFDGHPRHRAKVEAAVRAGLDNADVVAMALAGSFAQGNADELSDVDLRLYVADAAIDRTVRGIPALSASCGTVIALFTGEHVGAPALSIVLFEDLVHVDFDVLSSSGAAEHNRGLPVHVLWERDGVSALLPGADATDVAGDLRWIEDRLWTWCWYIQSKILRGELYEALDGLQYVRDQVLFRLVAFERGTRPAGARRVEDALGDREEAFAHTIPHAHAAGAALSALRAEIDLYLDLGSPLFAQHGVSTNEEARAVVRHALDVGLDWSPAGS